MVRCTTMFTCFNRVNLPTKFTPAKPQASSGAWTSTMPEKSNTLQIPSMVDLFGHGVPGARSGLAVRTVSKVRIWKRLSQTQALAAWDFASLPVS